MKKLKYLILCIIFGGAFSYGKAQDFVTVNGTVTDSDNTNWTIGNWQAQLVNPRGGTVRFLDTQVPLTGAQLNLSGQLVSGATFTTSIANNAALSPAGTQWVFTFCPGISFQCSALSNLSITSNTNLSSTITAQIKTPRLPATGANVYAYTDTEISPTPVPGGFYFNVISLVQRIWNGNNWYTGASGASLGVINPLDHGAICNWNPVTRVGNDDTTAMLATYTFAKNNIGPFGIPIIQISGGSNCRMTSTLKGSFWIQGAADLTSSLTLTAPGLTGTTDVNLLTITPVDLPESPSFGFAGSLGVRDLTLSGDGANTGLDSALIEVNGTVGTRIENVREVYHSGVGLSIQGSTERMVVDNLRTTYVRQPVITGVSGNETYFFNFIAEYAGATGSTFGPGGSVLCYSINCPSNTYVTSGNVYPNNFAAVTIMNSDNIKFVGGSIKPLQYVTGFDFMGSGMHSIDHVYLESGFASPAIVVGGKAGGFQTAQALGTGTGSFNINPSTAIWFPIKSGSASDLPLYSTGDAEPMVVIPPDYNVNSSSASVLGGGILQNTYEYIYILGIANDTHQVNITSRGVNGTTAVNWPSTAVISTLAGAPNVSLFQPHINVNDNPNPGAPYTYIQDNADCHGSAEYIVGSQPCNAYGQTFPNGYPNWNSFIQPLSHYAAASLSLYNPNMVNGTQNGSNYTQGSLLAHNVAIINLYGTDTLPTTDPFTNPYKFQFYNYTGSYITVAQYANNTAAILTINDPFNNRYITTSPYQMSNADTEKSTFRQFNVDQSFTFSEQTTSSHAWTDGFPRTSYPTLTATTGGSLSAGYYWVRVADSSLVVGGGNCSVCGGNTSTDSVITTTNVGAGYTPGVGASVSIANCNSGNPVGYAVIGQGDPISGPYGTINSLILTNPLATCTSTSPQTITLTSYGAPPTTNYAGTLTPQQKNIQGPTPPMAVKISGSNNAFTVSSPTSGFFGIGTTYNVYVSPVNEQGQEVLQANTTIGTPTTITSINTSGAVIPYPENYNYQIFTNQLLMKGCPLYCSAPELSWWNYTIAGGLTKSWSLTPSAWAAPASFTVGGGAAITNSNQVPHVGTPNLNQAACIKSVGPPVIIGYCSTVVGSGGACTCN